MGFLVEANRLGYYNNKRQRPGAQFVMREKDFFKYEKVLDKDGKETGKMKPVLKEGSKDEYEHTSWVDFVEDGHPDPIEAPVAPKKKLVNKAKVQAEAQKASAKEKGKAPAPAMQNDSFPVDTESGLQVTGQVPPATPAASSQQAKAPADTKAPAPTGDKEVI